MQWSRVDGKRELRHMHSSHPVSNEDLLFSTQDSISHIRHESFPIRVPVDSNVMTMTPNQHMNTIHYSVWASPQCPQNVTLLTGLPAALLNSPFHLTIFPHRDERAISVSWFVWNIRWSIRIRFTGTCVRDTNWLRTVNKIQQWIYLIYLLPSWTTIHPTAPVWAWRMPISISLWDLYGGFNTRCYTLYTVSA